LNVIYETRFGGFYFTLICVQRVKIYIFPKGYLVLEKAQYLDYDKENIVLMSKVILTSCHKHQQ
jgi:hypothetical protein